MIRKLWIVMIACVSLWSAQAGLAAAAPAPAGASSAVPAANAASSANAGTATAAAPGVNAAAMSAANGQQRLYETPFAQNDATLSGVAASRQEYFQVMNFWNVSEVKVNLDFQVSQIAEDKRSSVTLLLNGSEFYSFRPSSENNGEQHLSITAPKGWLKRGTNTLEIKGYIRSGTDDQICSRDEYTDQWLHLYNTSSIDVRYTNKPLTGAVSDFNERFAAPDTVSAQRSLLAVPENSSAAELEAAVYALSGFAKSNTLADKQIPLAVYRADQWKDKEEVVLVAMYDRLPAELKSKLGGQPASGKALIQLVHADKTAVLVVTSTDEKLLIKAGRLIANQALMAQLEGGSKLVDESTDVATPDIEINKRIAFTETGDKLTGPYHQEHAYFVSLPANRSIAAAGKVKLDFRYAQNLDFDRSLVTVLINDTPIGSKKLSKERADGDSAAFDIPGNLAVSGNFTVTVAFDLELNDAICTPNQSQMPWAFITKDSMMQLNTKDRTDLLFNNYPYPFLRDASFNHVAVVLPRERDDYTYAALSSLFNLLGQYASSNAGEVRFYEDSVSKSELQDRNIIAVGSYRNNRTIRENNGSLYFRYDPSGSYFESNEKMSIDAGYGKRIGALQLIPSPYREGRGFLAVTGAGSEEYYLASKLVATEQAKWKIYGDGVVTDRDGNIHAYRFKKLSGETKESVIQSVTRPDVLRFVTAAALVMSLVVVSLVLLLRKHRKRGSRK